MTEEHTPDVQSPPPVNPTPAANNETDALRRRLFELRTALTERFDRRCWNEYLQLRRNKTLNP